VLNTVLPITRVLQKQGISGLLNICATIKHCAKFELSYLEALPSQSRERYRQDYDSDPKTTIILSFVPDCVFPLSFNGK